MGGQEIFIIQGDSEARISDGATMEGRINAGLMGLLADKGSSLIDGLNTTIEGVNDILGANSANIEALVAHLESMTASIDSLLASSKGDIEGAVSDLSTFTSTLAANTDKIESMISSLDTFTSDVAEADFVTKLDTTLASINDIVASLESGQGSVGMLLKDAELYNSLNDAGENLALLLEDLKANPMRYVHFSLFGQSEEKIAEKAAKRAEREAKRAARKAE
jgi:phospholipid/cholesterol/gamma-HCH transport system substrate-binding protein